MTTPTEPVQPRRFRRDLPGFAALFLLAICPVLAFVAWGLAFGGNRWFTVAAWGFVVAEIAVGMWLVRWLRTR